MPRKTFSPLILLTRPEPAASETAALLRDKGYGVLISSTLVAAPLPSRDLFLDETEQLIVTSPQAARFLKQWTGLHACPVWAVGAQTAQLLQASGFSRVIYQGSESATTLLAQINSQSDKQFCILGAPTTGRDLQGSLQRKGYQARREAVYRIDPVTTLPDQVHRALQEETITHALFYSARTAQSFCKLVSAYDLRSTNALCLSQTVSQGLKTTRFRAIEVAMRPTSEALQALLPALDSRL